MVSKNNMSFYNQKMNRKDFRFSLRKLNIGVASVLVGIGFGIFALNGQVSADEMHASNEPAVEKVATSSAATSSAASSAATEKVNAAVSPVTSAANTNDEIKAQTINKFKDGDMSQLPNNINWQTPRHDAPLSGFTDNNDHGVDQKGPAIIYNPIQQNGAEGYNVQVNTNKQFTWNIDGIVGISKNGQAISDGTGKSGIINPENKQNVIWLGKYFPSGNDTLGGFTAKDAIKNADALPEGTTFDFESGWFKPEAGRPGVVTPAKQGESGAQQYLFPSTGSLKIQPIVVKITYPDTTINYVTSRLAVNAIWNDGISQDIDVDRNKEVVITPSWISNGNINGTDQIKTIIYDGNNPLIPDNIDSVKPLATFITNAQNSQGFVYKNGNTTKLHVVFKAANTAVQHTGLKDNGDILVSGLTGVDAVDGSNVQARVSSVSSAISEAFNYPIILTNDGQSPVAEGSKLIVDFSKPINHSDVQKIDNVKSFTWISDSKLEMVLPEIAVNKSLNIKINDLKSKQLGSIKINGEVQYNTATVNNGGYVNGVKGFNNQSEFNGSIMINSDSDTYTPQTTEITVKHGDKAPEAISGISNMKDLPAGTTVAWDKTPDTNKLGKTTYPATVTYPDGSKDAVEIPVNVIPNDADNYTPETQPIIAPKGSEPKASDGIKNLPDLPAGTKVDWNKTPDTTKPGTTTDYPAIVIYPDGSQDQVVIPVHVPSDAETYTPKTTEITVKHGDKAPEAISGISNMKDLPAGTNVAWDKTPDTSKTGKTSYPAIVTYPDGSKDAVEIPVNVIPNDADKYTPETQPIVAPKDSEPKASDGIKNLPDLPAGTTVDWDKTPDTTKEGTTEYPATVTYPDGSQDHIMIPVTVVTPKTQPITVKPGQVPDAKSGIANWNDLPAGTTIAWDKTPDTSKPGTTEWGATITYPDGRTEHVMISVTVAQPSNNNNGNNMNSNANNGNGNNGSMNNSGAMNNSNNGNGNNNAAMNMNNSNANTSSEAASVNDNMNTNTESSSSNSNNNNAEAKKLPQTSDNNAEANGAIALEIMGMISALGLLGIKNRRRDNK